MNRHTFAYLFISLMMVALAFGSLPFAAAETSNAPIGMTETPTPPPNTPIPNTPIPNTPIPNTPTAPAVIGLPNTGGSAQQNEAFPWLLVFAPPVVGSLIVLGFGLRIRARRLMQRKI